MLLNLDPKMVFLNTTTPLERSKHTAQQQCMCTQCGRFLLFTPPTRQGLCPGLQTLPQTRFHAQHNRKGPEDSDVHQTVHAPPPTTTTHTVWLLAPHIYSAPTKLCVLDS
jgi:hypothetical protein